MSYDLLVTTGRGQQSRDSYGILTGPGLIKIFEIWKSENWRDSGIFEKIDSFSAKSVKQLVSYDYNNKV